MGHSKYLLLIFTTLVFFQFGCTKNQFSSNQPENDDMYYASTDREKVLYDISGKSQSSSNNSTADKDVNPEYINSYAKESRQDVKRDQNGEYAEEEYYDEDVADRRSDNYSNYNNNWGYNDYVYNGYYGPYGYGRPYISYPAYSYYDPFWGPSMYSPRSTFWLSFGFGSSWGHPYNNWYGMYDPFWNSYYGYNPYYGGFGGYNMGFYDGYRMGVYNNYYYPYYRNSGREVAVRYVNRGSRVTRGASYNNRLGLSANTGRTSRATRSRDTESNRVGTVNSGSSNRRENVAERPQRGTGRDRVASGTATDTRRENSTQRITESQRTTTDNPNRRSYSEGTRSRDNFNSRPSTSRPSTSPRTRSSYGDNNYSSPSRSSGSTYRTDSYNNNRSNNTYSSPSPSRSSGSEMRSSPSRSSSPSSGSSSGGRGSSSGSGSRGTGRR